jgi:proteic killer suppression protein
MKMIEIIISPSAIKDLKKLPAEVIDQLDYWIGLVEDVGIREVRKIKGYHDEPLKGDRKGQRSIRLSRAYRAIYTIDENENILITIIEVNKHKY